MSEQVVTAHNLMKFMDELQTELESEPVLLVTTKTGKIGKWGMARVWRAWMSDTAKWMAKNGATMPLYVKSDGSVYGNRPFNKDDAHELFTSQWLGVDKNGDRLSWAKRAHDGMRVATKGERFLAMQRHEQYATERGILLFNPRDSEYQQIKGEG